MTASARLGRRIRALRKKEGLTQAALARKLEVSASYLNLIENDRRPLPAELLIRLSGLFDLDIRSFGVEGDSKLSADIQEVFGDPLFDGRTLDPEEVREFVAGTPSAAGAVVHLYYAYQSARMSLQSLAESLPPDQISGIDRVRLSSEQVSDFIQNHGNYFPDLEEDAEVIRKDARLQDEDLFEGLANFLEERHKVKVQIETVDGMRGALRRFDAERRTLLLSEVLRRGSRNFQLAHQVGLLSCSESLSRMSAAPQLTSDESRSLIRVALANYFASAVLMPYDEFLRAAQEVRYDIDLLGHRFRASFEQVCHRLTTLRRPGGEGVQFHMVRIDIAGNISKKLGAIGVQFPRFSGLCPLWNVHAAYLRPGFIRTQVSRLPDGTSFFSVARTVRKHRGGYQARNVLNAIGLGCRVEEAKELVYSDGVDLENTSAYVPVGVMCRLCERMDCEARAFPPLQESMRIDENVLGVSFFAPLDEV